MVAASRRINQLQVLAQFAAEYCFPLYVIITDAVHSMVERVLKMQHTDADIEKELNTIVDLGGYVKDIFVYHKAYHIVRAPLNIASRLDVKKYLDNLKCGKSISLMTVTSGYHYHTICAETDERLDEIQEALSKLGYLAKLQEYEPVEF